MTTAELAEKMLNARLGNAGAEIVRLTLTGVSIREETLEKLNAMLGGYVAAFLGGAKTTIMWFPRKGI